MTEWKDALWVPVGEPVQARSWQRPADHRKQPRDAYLQWGFKAGKDGIFLAARATGDLARDSFTVFLDGRPPELLGTAGRYYWFSGKLGLEGRIELSKGETSQTAPGMDGRWKKTAEGVDLELFVPYAAMDSGAWPQSGDLGLSIVWIHRNKDDKRTDLLWSENGHWWNPRWYGVVRRTDGADPHLPYRVRTVP